MIAFANKAELHASPVDWHERFLEMLPSIRYLARIASNGMGPESRQEFVSEVIAIVALDVARLADQGRLHKAFATPLARFAIRRVRTGRCAASRLNSGDVTSLRCRLRKGVHVQSLSQLDGEGRKDGQWREVLIEDRRAGPAETATARLDLAAWLGSMSPRRRQIAEALARGETTSAVAHTFGVVPSRISELRHQLRESWLRFQGELPDISRSLAAAA